MIQKHTRNTPSHLSDFDSTNARRQEGSITIAFAKSISCALVQSISSVSRAINLQLWTWYHVTLRYYVEYNMKLPYCCWSVYLAGYFTGLEMLRERLLRARASLVSSAHDVSLSFILSLSLCHLSRDRRPRQLVEAHWDHQQRHEQHKGLKGEDTPCNNTLRLPLHLVITSKVSIQAAGMITFVCLQGF